MVLSLKMKKGVPTNESAEDDTPAHRPKAGIKEPPPRKSLKLRAHHSSENAQSIHDGPNVLTGDELKKRRDKESKAAKKAVRKKKESGVLEYVVLVLVAAPLTYFLWQQSISPNSDWIEKYVAYRLPVLVIAWIAVIIQAFRLTRLSGVLTFIFPPYWAYFLLTEVDSKLLRGVATALLIVVMMELAFIPKHAFLTHAQANFNRLVNQTQGGLTSDANYNVR